MENIVERLISLYGLEQTITFADMNAFVYGEMYKEISEHPMDNQELIYEYDYQQYWWKKVYNDLTGKEEEI